MYLAYRQPTSSVYRFGDQVQLSCIRGANSDLMAVDIALNNGKVITRKFAFNIRRQMLPPKFDAHLNKTAYSEFPDANSDSFKKLQASRCCDKG